MSHENPSGGDDEFMLPPSIEDDEESRVRTPTPPPAYVPFSPSPGRPTGLRKPSSRLPSYEEAAAPTAAAASRTSPPRPRAYDPYDRDDGIDDADFWRASQDLEMALAFPHVVECPRYGTFTEDAGYGEEDDDDLAARLRRSEAAPSLLGAFALAIFCTVLCIGLWMVTLLFVASKHLPPNPRVPTP
ncbi:hypothetical protein PG995_010938 [Apiospora arundinis]